MIVLHGVQEFIAAVDAQNERMRVATKRATARALHVIERRTKQKLTTSSHEAGTPTPSAPGEPPSLITGNLRRSVTVTGPETLTRSSWRGQVGPTAVYGRIQELGGEVTSPHTSMVMSGVTGSGIRIPSRPYLAPAYAESLAEVRAIFLQAWTEVIVK